MSVTAYSTQYSRDWDTHWCALSAIARETPTTPAIDNRCYRLLRDMHVFRTLLPHKLQGVEADPLDAMALIEDMATLSGTVGWVSLVGITGAIFATELAISAAREVYADPDAMIAYAGASSSGTVVRQGDHLVLSGRWDLASGLTHATWVAVGCQIVEGTDSGTAVVLVPRSECEVSFDWDPIGLAGTGTGAVAIEGAPIPRHRVIVDRSQTRDHRSRRRYRHLIPSMIASVSLGVARAALDETAAWLSGEAAPQSGPRRADSEHVQHLVGRAHAELRSARAFLREVTAETWRRACLGEDPGLDQGALHRLAATHAATVPAETSAAVATVAGTRAVTGSNPICRRWIDARTITANITVRDLYYRVYGGVATGGQVPHLWP